MGLYQELGIENAGSPDAIRDLLTQEKNQLEEQRRSTTSAEEAEQDWKMVQNIDHLLNVLGQVRDSVPDVTLPLETVCCALDYEISEYADLEDSVIWVCTRRMFKSDYRNIVAFLESVHADALADDWRSFAQNSAREAEEEADPARNKKPDKAELAENPERKPTKEDKRDARGRKRDRGHEDLSLESEDKRSLGEVILVIAIIVMAILIIGGLFLIWRSRRDSQTTEQAAQAAMSESTSSGLISTAPEDGSTAAGDAGSDEESSTESSAADTAASAAEEENAAASLPDGEESSESASSGSSEEDTAALLQRMADYTILSDETVFPILNEVSCSGSTATSTLTGDSGRVYGTDYLFDNDMSTSWQEGEKDEGIGQSLTFTFDETTDLRAIAIWSGSESSSRSYKDSNRPSDITVSITCGSDSNEQAMTLDDIDGEQMIVFDDPVPTDSLTITIDGVYKGRQFNDTAISEMKFYTE